MLSLHVGGLFAPSDFPGLCPKGARRKKNRSVGPGQTRKLCMAAIVEAESVAVTAASTASADSVTKRDL